jgi:hypothetical protein
MLTICKLYQVTLYRLPHKTKETRREVMNKFFWGILVAIFCSLAFNANCAVTAYNTFLDQPQTSTQEPGFGYSGGAQVTEDIFGNSFIPTARGTVSDIWIGVTSALADVGTDIFDVILATSGTQDEPNTELARFAVEGELSKRESVVHISALDAGVFVEENIRYWMLISPGPGTPEVGWLGGPPNSPPGALSAYPDSGSPTGWFIADFNANGAMRIDVTNVPLPTAVWLFASGLIGLLGVARRRRIHLAFG